MAELTAAQKDILDLICNHDYQLLRDYNGYCYLRKWNIGGIVRDQFGVNRRSVSRLENLNILVVNHRDIQGTDYLVFNKPIA